MLSVRWSWQLDETWYPGFREFVTKWKARGVRVLTYVNPFLMPPEPKANRAIKTTFYEAFANRGWLVPDVTNTTATAGDIPPLLMPSSFEALGHPCQDADGALAVRVDFLGELLELKITSHRLFDLTPRAPLAAATRSSSKRAPVHKIAAPRPKRPALGARTT